VTDLPEIDPAELVWRVAGGLGPVVRRLANLEQTTFDEFEARAGDPHKAPVLLVAPKGPATVHLPALIDLLAGSELEGFHAEVHDDLIAVHFDEDYDALYAERDLCADGWPNLLLWVEEAS